MDGAKYHTSGAAREFLASQRVNLVYTGPNAYASSPIERLFAALKTGDLDPLKEATRSK